ncbi:MAG: hypothetical protein HC884_05535 [Chloroflexaceae bacterium]|nr:hypothetical protein [Chloroflexaceae bacterium]
MKRIAALIAIVVGALLLVLGLIFLIAAIANPQRLLNALALAVLGVPLIAFGIWVLVREKQLSADTLDDSIVELARRSNAEVTVDQVVAELGVPDQAARDALDLLERRQQARGEWREDRKVYLFPGLKESKVVRRCAHCHSIFSVAQPLHKCPNCGSTEVELVRE